MWRNQISGNGYVLSANPDFGLGLLGGVTDNLFEENVVTGNVTGVRINASAVRNVFRGNVIAGNPPILVANNAPDNAASGFDILNLAPAGANTFENNTCVTSMNAPCGSLKPEADVLPFANVVSFNTPRAPRGGSVTVTFSGNNLTTKLILMSASAHPVQPPMTLPSIGSRGLRRHTRCQRALLLEIGRSRV